ncbi:hypothetical protein [Culturomica massiliensis]|uniref:hypothetical protein n=1 Tax=Culturomica massiliensis TaxID=1841857 RepID=UPI003AB2839C
MKSCLDEKERILSWKQKNEERIIRNAKSKVYKWAIFVLAFTLFGLVICVFVIGIDHALETMIPAVMMNLVCLTGMWYAQNRYARRILERKENEKTK